MFQEVEEEFYPEEGPSQTPYPALSSLACADVSNLVSEELPTLPPSPQPPDDLQTTTLRGKKRRNCERDTSVLPVILDRMNHEYEVQKPKRDANSHRMYLYQFEQFMGTLNPHLLVRFKVDMQNLMLKYQDLMDV